MPEIRTLMLMKCVGSPGHHDDGKFWLAETYMTSDGPRMRVIPCAGWTEEQARAEMQRRQDLIEPPKLDLVLAEARRAAYARGMRDANSRLPSSPGNGDMGG